MKTLCIVCGKETEQGGYTARMKGHILRPVCEHCQNLCSTYPDQVLWENPHLLTQFLPERQSVDAAEPNSRNEVLEWRDRLRKMLLKNDVTQPPRRAEAGRNFLLLGITLWAFVVLLMVYNVYRSFTSEVYSDYRIPDLIRAEDQAFTDMIFATILFLSSTAGIPTFLYFRNKGRRTLAPDAFAELDRLPDRRPVLFLRPFSRGPSNLPLYKVFEVGDWFELAVVEELRKNWPVIAIGKPGEQLPPMGAGRFYVPDIHWEETVSWFLSECQLIMLVYGTASGLLSELRMIVDQGVPSKLVLCIPEGGRSTRKNRNAWREFKEKTGNIFPRPLPDSPGRALFMRFDAKWNPVIVAPSSRRSRLRSRAVRVALRAALVNTAELERP